MIGRIGASFARVACKPKFTFIERDSLIIGGVTDPESLKEVTSQPEFSVISESFRVGNSNINPLSNK